MASFSVPVPQHVDGRFVSGGSDKHKLWRGLDVFVISDAIEPATILLVAACAVDSVRMSVRPLQP